MRQGKAFVVAMLVAFSAGAPAGVARSEENARGKELFELCAQCHGSQGGGNPEALAPAIAGLQAWYVEMQVGYFRAGARGLHPEDVGGLRMYPMSLSLKSDEDVRAVSAYVASLPPKRPARLVEGGDATRGAGLYAVCASCHGVDGSGNQQLQAPSFAGASDWYLLSSLQKFKAGIRGNDPSNTTAAIMRGMVGTLPDEQAMKDVVAHIMSLSKADGQ